MPKLDRYLSSEIARSVFAALVVLGMVSLGGLFADLLGGHPRGLGTVAALVSAMAVYFPKLMADCLSMLPTKYFSLNQLVR